MTHTHTHTHRHTDTRTRMHMHKAHARPGVTRSLHAYLEVALAELYVCVYVCVSAASK